MMYSMHGSKDASLAKPSLGQGELGIDEWYQRCEMKLVLGGEDGLVCWIVFRMDRRCGPSR